MKMPKRRAETILSTLALSLVAWVVCPGLGAQVDPGPVPCGQIADLPPLLQAGTVLLLGELHGTVEVPQFLTDTVCLALQAGHEVTVGLEIPSAEEAAIAAYLKSEGSAKDRALLLDSTFWQRPPKDGRTSKAMFALIEQLRRLKHAGRPVKITLLDLSGAEQRDRAMANHLKRSIEASPTDFFVALTGNLHNRMTRGAVWDESWEPMGYLVAADLPTHKLISLDLSFTEGTAWFCANDCGEHKIRGQGDGEARRIVLFDTLNTNGHHGLYHVGRVTASPPAVSSAGETRR